MYQEDTLKDWVITHYEHNTLADICNHGCINGFPGLTYYSDTVAVYDRYCECIWDMLYDDCENFGNKNILEMIGEFNGAKNVGSDAQFKNLLAWYAVEKIALDITEGEYLSDDE